MSSVHHEEFSESFGTSKQMEVFDFPALLTMLAIIGIGLISIYSATYDAEMSKYFIKQFTFAGIGMASLLAMLFIPSVWLRISAPFMYLFSIILLLAVLIPGIGHKINGQQCWISIGGFQFQPSEFAKISTLLMIGRYVEGKGVNIVNLRDLGYTIGIVALPVILILGEPDTGTATVFLAMLLGILLWSGADLFMLFVIGVLPVVGITAIYGVMYETTIPIIVCIAILALVIVYFRRSVVLSTAVLALFIAIGVGISPIYNKLPDHQKSRIKTFFEPEKYPKDEGYHVIQSMMAVGSGGLTGKGFLHGTQTQLRYIPEQWTDFIFCVPGEEFGFIGSVTVLGLLSFLILRILRIARLCKDEFSTVIAFGFATILLYHTLVNIGMAIGVFPVMGIPLPFMSSGGTALIANMTTMGILLNFYRSKQKSLMMM